MSYNKKSVAYVDVFSQACDRVSLSDLLVIIGVLCLAFSVWVALGWVGVLGFLGAVLVVVGLVLAQREGDRVKG